MKYPQTTEEIAKANEEANWKKERNAMIVYSVLLYSLGIAMGYLLGLL